MPVLKCQYQLPSLIFPGKLTLLLPQSVKFPGLKVPRYYMFVKQYIFLILSQIYFHYCTFSFKKILSNANAKEKNGF